MKQSLTHCSFSVRGNIFAVIMIAVTAVMIYSHTFHVPFVFDDIDSIVANSKIRDLAHFRTLKVLTYQRPLVDYTFALNYRYGGLNVSGYHLVNLLIHVSNGILAFFLSLALFRKLSGKGTEDIFISALVAALIFTAHPIQTQAVTYISQRYTSMAAFFYMSSVFCYLAARDAMAAKGRTTAYLLYFLTFLSGVMAFLSKQNSASLPFAILLVEYACYDRSWKGWMKKIRIVLPMVLVIGLFYFYNLGLFRHNIQFAKLLEDVSEVSQQTQRIGRWQYLCTQFNVISIYIRLLLLPVRQNLDYLYPVKTGFFDGATPYAFMFLLAVIITGWRCRKTIPVVFFGIFWFFITLSVESSIFPISDVLFEHRLYLPMFGFSLVAASAFAWVFSKRRVLAYVLALSAVLSLSAAAYARNTVWRNGISLWSDVIRKAPGNYRAYNNLGIEWMQHGDLKAAVANYDESIRLKTNYSVAISNKGILMEKMGNNDEGIMLFRKALAIDPNLTAVRINLSTALRTKADELSASKNYSEAIVIYEESLRVFPNSVKTHVNLGVAYIHAGRNDAAVKQFRSAVAIDPVSVEAITNLGIALYYQGKTADALQQLDKALRLNPNSEEIKNNIALIMNSVKNGPGIKTGQQGP